MSAAYLKEFGYEVVTAKNGSEALSLPAQEALDVIILDQNLAGESGVALIPALKEKYPKVPIILFTGMEQDEATIQKIIKLGADQYLRKRTMEELLQAVQTASPD
ncbi:MAG: two component, sigma54 specific, transcriptional regulator, Fis family [Pedosphaera sp.]|nr:two component, sigma54 specific, transcriptional regulator, Fis family [Pedosphaera sp.]